MATTVNRDYPLPNEAKTVREEFETLAAFTLPMIDLDMQSLFDALAGKADADHEHQIGDIPGLENALSELMPKTKTFALADLLDVEGSVEAPNGYVLIKTGGLWVAQAAAAALGTHSHTIAQISGLGSALNSKADLTSVVRHDVAQALTVAQQNQFKANAGIADTASTLAPAIVAAPGKATPANADVLGIADSEDGGALKKLSWANLKATLKAYFDAIFAAVSHEHSAADITSGTLPISRGGTGETTEAGMRGVYTGSAVYNTVYPIGAYLAVSSSPPDNAPNDAATIRVYQGSGSLWITTDIVMGTGYTARATMAGTWRKRGSGIYQRVA